MAGPPNLSYGQVPTAGQWNQFFATKQDALGYTPVNRAGDTMFGKLNILASSTANAGINLVHGTAPDIPLDGDVWTTNTGLFVQISGNTIGPIRNGNVAGPNVSVANNIATFADVTGGVIKDSGTAVTSLIQNSRQVIAGTGLTGGGTLSGDVTIGLNSASATSLALADSSAQKGQNLADLSSKPTARSNISTPGYVADRTTLAAINPVAEQSSILYEDTQKGIFYPKLISTLSSSAAAAMAVDLTQQIYVQSTQNPAYVMIRQGAELRGFYSNSTTPAYVHRLRERVMIGESAGFDCSTAPDSNTGAAWLYTVKPGATNGMGYLEIHGRVVSTGSNGAQFVGATRITGTAPVEGYGGIFHVRNESTNDRDAWGIYIDAVRGSATAGNVAGVELDIANCSGTTDAKYLPYGFEGQSTPTAWSYGLSLASGGDITTNPDALPVSHALGIINNGSTFHTGIVFRSDALTLDGSGYGEAIALGQKHKIGWHLSGGEASYLTSVATTLATGVRALLIDNGLELRRSGNDQPFFRALTSSTAVNFIELAANVTGSGPIIRAASSGDANQNIVFQPAGTGVLQVTYVAAVTADVASNRRVRIRTAGENIDLLGVLV
jgi:hypothetical protein